MTTPDLDHLETLAKAATPGPWLVVRGERFTSIDCMAGEAVVYYTNDDDGVHGRSEGDLGFIAAANPATVLALIRELRAAQRVVRCGQAVCEAWSYDNHLSKPGTSIGYLRDALTAYNAAISANDDAATKETT